MKIWNLNVKRGVDGSKHLDIQLHGVIDGGWLDENPVNTDQIISELNTHADAKTIGVRINSIGGAAFGGVALYNALQAHPGEVTCCVEGLAASAASLVAMAGKTVMGRGSMMMVHSPSTMAMGNAKELRKTADVLDKVQASLATIYTAKTGKSLDEVNDLLDEETWMTADEAVEAGFADEVMDHAADGDPEGSAEEESEETPDEERREQEEQAAPESRGEFLVWNGVPFPKTAFPEQVLAMAKSKMKEPKMAKPTAPEPVAPLVNRAWLAERAPELLASLIEEGRTAGASAERARLQAIDDMPALGCADLVAQAKYGDKPTDAPTLAMAIVKAQKGAGAELLAARRLESAPVTAVLPAAPDQTARAAEERLIKAMTDGGNATRGGVK